MRNNATAPIIRRLLEHTRYEVLPTSDVAEQVQAHVPADLTVTITASPAKGLAATLDLAEQLSVAGYRVVPHLAARMIKGKGELAEICDRLTSLGIDSIFVPAGDQDPPAGDYDAALGLLEDLAELGSPFAHVGITGYPESHPSLHDDVTIQAMWDKRRYATHVVSNLTFDAATLTGWVKRLRVRGVTMPLLIGLAGPVGRTKLLAMATKIGVVDSTKFLAKNKRMFARIATPGGYDPMRLLQHCASTFADPSMRVEGLHVFTFNQVAETDRWRREQLQLLAD